MYQSRPRYGRAPAVIDSGGNLVMLHRLDNAQLSSVRIAEARLPPRLNSADRPRRSKTRSAPAAWSQRVDVRRARRRRRRSDYRRWTCCRSDRRIGSSFAPGRASRNCGCRRRQVITPRGLRLCGSRPSKLLGRARNHSAACYEHAVLHTSFRRCRDCHAPANSQLSAGRPRERVAAKASSLGGHLAGHSVPLSAHLESIDPTFALAQRGSASA